MSIFARLDFAAHHAQEVVYGDRFVFQPMKRAKNVNKAWIADPARGPGDLIITAIYVERDAPINLPENSVPEQDHRPGVAAHIHTIEIDPRRWLVEPRVGDMLTSLADNRKWQIEQTDPTDVGRMICSVRLLGSPT